MTARHRSDPATLPFTPLTRVDIAGLRVDTLIRGEQLCLRPCGAPSLTIELRDLHLLLCGREDPRFTADQVDLARSAGARLHLLGLLPVPAAYVTRNVQGPAADLELN